MLEKIAKLIALAEAAGTAEEAEAAFAKAQALASRYAIDLEVARRQAEPAKREEPTMRVVRIGEKGKRSNASLVRLFSVVGDANDVSILIAADSTFVEAYGYPSDIDAAEALWASLAATMTRFADALVRDRKAAWRSETTYDWNTGVERPVTGQGARRSFNEGFTYRIGERLREARQRAVADADDHFHKHAGAQQSGAQSGAQGLPSSMALMLKEKGATVETYMYDEYRRRYGRRRVGSWRGGRSSAAHSTTARSEGVSRANSTALSAQRGIGS